MRMILLACLLALAAAPADLGEATVTLLDGSMITGRVAALDAAQITVDTADGPQQAPREQLLDVQWNREAAAPDLPGIAVELVDGTRLAISEFSAAGRAITVHSPYAERPLRIARERVRQVQLQPPTDDVLALHSELNQKELTGDVLLVVQREGGPSDYLVGIVGNVTADAVSFEWEGQQLDAKRSKVSSIIFYHAAERTLADAICELTLVDGSHILANDISLDGVGRLTLRTPTGVRLVASQDNLARADFSAGKLAYLSDLKPTESRWTPQIALPKAALLIADYGQPRNDESFSGSPLLLAWEDPSSPTGHEIRAYTKGLALRSRSELTYRLPDGMRRFTTTAGIDPATASQGHVVLEIRADDRVVWEGEIDGKRPPVDINLDVGAARRLQLRVDYGRNLDYGDRLHLVEARITK
jgi:hypothetical protein